LPFRSVLGPFAPERADPNPAILIDPRLWELMASGEPSWVLTLGRPLSGGLLSGGQRQLIIRRTLALVQVMVLKPSGRCRLSSRADNNIYRWHCGRGAH